MKTVLLASYRQMLEESGFETALLPTDDTTPYDALVFQVPGGDEAGMAVVHINFLPVDGDGSTALGQIIVQLPQLVAPGAEGAILEVAAEVNRSILLGHFMPGPGRTLFWRHTFYVPLKVAPEHNVQVMNQMLGLVLHTLHRMWEPLGRTAQGQIGAEQAIEMVRQAVPR